MPPSCSQFQDHSFSRPVVQKDGVSSICSRSLPFTAMEGERTQSDFFLQPNSGPKLATTSKQL